MPGINKATEEKLRKLYRERDKLIERINAAKQHGERYIKWGWLSKLTIEEAEKELVKIRNDIIRAERSAGLKMGFRPAFAH